MTYKQIVVVPTYPLWINDFWNVQKALIIEYFFNSFSALQQSLWSQFLYFFVIVLQLGKSQSHIFNTSII